MIGIFVKKKFCFISMRYLFTRNDRHQVDISQMFPVSDVEHVTFNFLHQTILSSSRKDP